MDWIETEVVQGTFSGLIEIMIEIMSWHADEAMLCNVEVNDGCISQENFVHGCTIII